MASGGRVLAYSSDTTVCDELVALARDADVFLAENTFGGGEARPGHPQTHLDSAEAGAVAARAGARRLVLTHFWPDADRERARREAQRAWCGDVVVARPHLEIDV